MACLLSFALAEPADGQAGSAANPAVVGTGTNILERNMARKGIVRAPSGPARNGIRIKTSHSGSLGNSSGTKTLTLTLPAGTKSETARIVLNGKDVTSKFSPASCSEGICETGTLSSEDGLRPEKNVLFSTAKKEDGTAASSRLRFAGADAQPASTSRRLSNFSSNVTAQDAATPSLPMLSSFLPPAIGLSTTNLGAVGPNSQWLQLGTQGKLFTAPGCSSRYSVIVLDRQTLVEKTSAPESSPACYNDGQQLAAYLQSLTANDLVIVGNNYFTNTDAGSGGGYFDTTAIGGTAYNCSATPVSNSNCGKLASSNNVPQGYIAIGAVGAASGTAFENYYLSNESSYSSSDPGAAGILTEDANGNYNFQSTGLRIFPGLQTSGPVEYIVNPGTSSTSSSSVTLVNPPFSSNTVYTSPTISGAGGYWLLILNRADLSQITPYGAPSSYSCSSSSNSGVINYTGCGLFFQTGPGTSLATRTANLQALTAALNNLNRREMVILTTVGNAGWTDNDTETNNAWNMANNNSASTETNIGSWTDNGYVELASALINLGIPDKETLYLSGGSAFTAITGQGLGNSLSGSAALSTTVNSQQGQTGYLHGLFTPDLQGLYRPGQNEQQAANADYSNFTINLVSAQQPVDWPEFASQMAGTDSMQGQEDAYAYLSWYLLNSWYVQGQAGGEGVPAPYAYDIHYFFTGSLNTLLDYHTFDPMNATWPGSPGFAYPCTSVSNGTCTWTSPDQSTSLSFTQNDFNSVKAQLHNEIVDLTNVLLYMVTGSTNMKDVVAAGNSNTALALLGAASEVAASLNQPNTSTTPVKVSASNILNMIGGFLTTVAQIGTDNFLSKADAKDLNASIDLVADLFSNASAVSGGLATAGSSASSGLPSADYALLTTIGQLANSDLQGQVLAGFDTTIDTITGDWAKLNAIGPQITDPNNATFFAPNQVLQNATIAGMNNASQRSLYLSLLPAVYQLHIWPMVASESYGNTNPSYPDMGYSSNGDADSCKPFYTGYNQPPPYSVAWYPTYGGVEYTATGWQKGDVLPIYPFQYSFASNPVDFYILAKQFTNLGESSANASIADSQLLMTLFTNQPGALNFPMFSFYARSGPMTWPLNGPSATIDFAVPLNESGENATGNLMSNICSVVAIGASGGGTAVGAAPPAGTPSPSATITTLNAPATGVLGEDVPLQATVTAPGNSGAIPAGTVRFRDGSTLLGSATLDATGTASFSASGLAIGQHTLAAYYVTSDSFAASNSPDTPLMVYANAPDMVLSLSAGSVNISYGATSSAVTVQASSLSGMTGTANFGCAGLPIGMVCNFTPAQSAISAGGNASTSLTITATAPKAAAAMPWFRSIAGILVCPIALFLLWRIRRGARVMQALLCLLLLAIVSVGSLTGCGGSTKVVNNPAALPSGQQAVLVTVTANSVTKSIPLVLNIQ